MNRVWVRRDPSEEESRRVAALGLLTGVAIGAATWYVTRLLLSRESISLRPDDGARELPAGRTATALPPGEATSSDRPG